MEPVLPMLVCWVAATGPREVQKAMEKNGFPMVKEGEDATNSRSGTYQRVCGWTEENGRWSSEGEIRYKPRDR